MKTSHELDVHHLYKEGIKRFWTQNAEMSRTANLASSNRRDENIS